MIFLQLLAFFAFLASMANGITNLADIPCGKSLVKNRRNGRIVNGRKTIPGEIPWNVFIRLDNGKDPTNPTVFCGGIILDKHYILTTAHCFIGIHDSKKIKVAVGKYNIKNPKEKHSYEVGVREIIIHSGYNYHGIPEHKDDIALLRLEKTLKWTDFVQPACLPRKNSFPTNYGSISGWGHQTHHGRAKVPIMTNGECHKWFETNNQRDNSPFHFRPLDSHICAFKKGVDACQGDSGSGLTIRNDDGVQTVVGLIVSGYECGISPGIYTRIFSHLNWIQDEINKRKPSRYSPTKQNHPLQRWPTKFAHSSS